MKKLVLLVFLLCFLCSCKQELFPEAPSAPAAPVAQPQNVIVTDEALYQPLSDSLSEAPSQCDYIHYLRFRLATDNDTPVPVHAVIIMIPGTLGGAGSFSLLGRELVASAGMDYPIEVWALDRRANCLEDQTGMQEAAATENPQAALDYYINGSSIGESKFVGFYEPAETLFLSEFGLQLLMQDIYAILVDKIPDPAARKKNVFIAGHSLGAALAADFAAWDFDNDAATASDAGFNNCAGLIGLEGTVGIWSSSSTPERRYKKKLARLRASGSGNPLITPEAMALIEILALNAAFAPDAECTIFRSLAVAPATGRLVKYFTTYGLEPGAGKPALGDFHISNEAMLGIFSDDNFQPISIGRVSLGFLAGGPVERRGSPWRGGGLFAPADGDSGTFYTWANFDATGTADDPDFTDMTGRVVLTTAESEVTDIQKYARILFEDPLNFYEWYFPDRLNLDLGIAAAPYRASYGIATLHLGQIDDLPKIEFLARNIPGYDHLDVLCAAADRPQRRKNEVIEPLLEFLSEHSTGTVLVP